MYAACLTPETDPTMVRRAMCGVPRVDALVLKAGYEPNSSRWLLDTLRDLRRELFLDPELQLAIGLPSADHQAVLKSIAAMLVELHEGTTTLASITPPTGEQLKSTVAADGQTLCDRQTGAALPGDATIEGVGVAMDAAPIFDGIDTGAKVVLASNPTAGGLTTAVVFEALDLSPRDWDRLATAVTIARIVEQPGNSTPLWMEVDEGGTPYILGTDTFTGEALERLLAEQSTMLANEPECRSVAIDLSQAGVVPTTPGRYQLAGISGAPPTGRQVVHLACRASGSVDVFEFHTSVPRGAVDWNIMVRSASQWNRP